ncbi:unnamed protein product [Acanthoscelides obtectus]|uniref:Uncharacterized protein n=1 Tax=Acanthoscelides obtectus TaxID=200917 RepID=A0A9P0PKN1_ACAOB|nr:unnamed protein product [Acanthoscelides obtectus]CAK1629553.1 hypothetical protein AOBTE_LOCUS5812 [Acanthoscelides obtectus]
MVKICMYRTDMDHHMDHMDHSQHTLHDHANHEMQTILFEQWHFETAGGSTCFGKHTITCNIERWRYRTKTRPQKNRRLCSRRC